MTKQEFLELVLSGNALGQYEVEDLVILVRENSIELHLAFDLTLRTFGTYNSDTFEFVDGIQLPKKMKVIEVESDPIVNDFTENNEGSLFYNTTTNELFFAAQINENIFKLPFNNNCLECEEEPIYTAQEQSEIYHALSILKRSNSEKVNAIAERIGFPRPRPNQS